MALSPVLPRTVRPAASSSVAKLQRQEAKNNLTRGVRGWKSEGSPAGGGRETPTGTRGARRGPGFEFLGGLGRVRQRGSAFPILQAVPGRRGRGVEMLRGASPRAWKGARLKPAQTLGREPDSWGARAARSLSRPRRAPPAAGPETPRLAGYPRRSRYKQRGRAGAQPRPRTRPGTRAWPNRGRGLCWGCAGRARAGGDRERAGRRFHPCEHGERGAWPGRRRSSPRRSWPESLRPEGASPRVHTSPGLPPPLPIRLRGCARDELRSAPGNCRELRWLVFQANRTDWVGPPAPASRGWWLLAARPSPGPRELGHAQRQSAQGRGQAAAGCTAGGSALAQPRLCSPRARRGSRRSGARGGARGGSGRSGARGRGSGEPAGSGAGVVALNFLLRDDRSSSGIFTQLDSPPPGIPAG